MKKCIAKKIMLLSTLFTSVVFMFMGCASTGGAENIENVKMSMESILGTDVTWAKDFNVKSYKNFYTDEYALHKMQDSVKYISFTQEIFTQQIDATKIKNNIFSYLSDNNINKDIRELKKGDIFVLPVKDEKYIFLITLHNKIETLTMNSQGGVSLPGNSLRHLDRYDGWGYDDGSGFKETNHYNGLVCKPCSYRWDTTIFLFPWVNIEKGEVTYMILDKINKRVDEFDLKFLGSYKK